MSPILVFALLLSRLSLIHAEFTPRFASKTMVYSTIIPPYGPGPATYYASIIKTTGRETAYAMTCIPPATLPTPKPSNYDPCQTSRFGTTSQTIHQGDGLWIVSRPPDSKGKIVTTQCMLSWEDNEMPKTRGGDLGGGVEICYAEDETPEEYDRRVASGNTDLGLGRHRVTVTGGWDFVVMPYTPTPVASSSSSIVSMTDIGATPTKGGPVVTVTLQIVPAGSGPVTYSGRRSALIAVLGTFVVLIIMW
ncbi:hypothetical protein K505DRAFT_371055 [Melanomma pulvis-pyrius CBS 109.77]|uniref:Lytic polysaccharide monooxygenase n=1 Tax=Melanomma pulvis-pyrius CBS 109.77 TaxID=1314802 RepID=A0A6A6XS93_9PLEO|nr:hypothetical protein K505DRAFT_371055 [Melanomma pulvis-pyrius CBS 109.77]